MIFTAPKRSLRRFYFYTCLSFCSQGGLPQCMLGYIPQEQTPPPIADHPPPGTDGYWSGQYASYWNAFLFSVFCPMFCTYFLCHLASACSEKLVMTFLFVDLVTQRKKSRRNVLTSQWPTNRAAGSGCYTVLLVVTLVLISDYWYKRNSPQFFTVWNVPGAVLVGASLESA